MSIAKQLRPMESLIEGVPLVNYTIRPATVEHCDKIYTLIQEYYSEYGIPSNRQFDKTTFRKDGFETDTPNFRCFVALSKSREDYNIIGFVLWFRNFIGNSNPQVWLEALFVTKKYRQKRVEQALFEHTIQVDNYY
ncbi:uncharacterized protein LOC126834715 isoform X2 [Adelges cooleyi]|uniref:uncharacterized protein LOC126834715 isoform X2 n=1 Tax=Adelges cooleyi TaxID=133065 RepID=UPI0021806C3E|nr:uncharacterized protein LOC126834715 isoform X2 [Adelges cooleyi]